MDLDKLIKFIESSFLSSLLKIDTITDISFNGQSIFYLDNYKGRQKSGILIDYETAKDFIRQIANLCEKQFSYQCPKLDVSAGKYRISALHNSIGRIKDEGAITFSIRIASDINRINIESGFLTPEVDDLLSVLIKSQVSLVIGGITGSGKTELQKYLITKMRNNERIIIIDSVSELEYARNNPSLDINFWLVNEENKNATIPQLIRTALRSNPDWLIVAEARGAEMIDVVNSSLTGHPIITTIHAHDVESMPSRIASMVLMNEKKMEYENVIRDISYNLRFYIYVARRIKSDGSVFRYISEIGYFNDKNMELIYEFDGERHRYSPLNQNAKKLLHGNENIMTSAQIFMRQGNL